MSAWLRVISVLKCCKVVFKEEADVSAEEPVEGRSLSDEGFSRSLSLAGPDSSDGVLAIVVADKGRTAVDQVDRRKIIIKGRERRK